MELLHERIEETETKPFKSRTKGRKTKKREDIGVVSKKLTLKRERFDKTREMRGIKNKEKRPENRFLKNIKGTERGEEDLLIETVEERLERYEVS